MNSLALVDYDVCVNKARANEVAVAELKRRLSDCDEETNRLRTAYEWAKRLATERAADGV